jgi:S-adenosyl methyltransferase
VPRGLRRQRPDRVAHARALLYSTKEGRTSYIDADLREPDAILGSAQVRDTLDLSRPVAVSLIAILQFVVDDDEARRLIERLLEPLAPGSVLALSTVTSDSAPEEVDGGVAAYNARGIPTRSRGKAEVERLFAGLDLIEPGVTLVNHWHADGAVTVDDAHVHMYGGVAVKR